MAAPVAERRRCCSEAVSLRATPSPSQTGHGAAQVGEICHRPRRAVELGIAADGDVEAEARGGREVLEGLEGEDSEGGSDRTQLGVDEDHLPVVAPAPQAAGECVRNPLADVLSRILEEVGPVGTGGAGGAAAEPGETNLVPRPSHLPHDGLRGNL